MRLEHPILAGRKSIDRDVLEPALLSAAKDIVRRNGAQALAARDIAKAVGCSVGTLYNVFDSMDGLQARIGQEVLADLHEFLSSKLTAAPDGAPAERMLVLALNYMRFARSEPGLWQVLFALPSPNGESRPAEFLREIDHLRQLTASVAAPLFDHMEPNQAALCATETAHVLWAAVHGITALSIDGTLGIVTATTAEQLTRRLVLDVMTGAERRRG